VNLQLARTAVAAASRAARRTVRAVATATDR
jgi:hypothetical protein